MQQKIRFGLAGAVSAAMLTLAGGALAQEASAEAGLALPAAGATAGGSDHAAMSEHIGFGYLGRRSIPIAGFSGGAPSAGSVDAPVVGVRYWLDPGMGLDVGLGFFSSGGSSETVSGGTTVETDDPGVMGFLLHAGLPFNLADDGHFSFQVIPELNVGFANSTVEQDPDDLKLSGFVFDIGARAGAEVHFGFIGIPQLALQGSIGVLFRMESRKAEQGDNEFSQSSTVITTTVGDNPWNIFTSNVSALYYF